MSQCVLCCAVVALVGWLELSQAQVVGHLQGWVWEHLELMLAVGTRPSEVAGWLEHLDAIPLCAIKVEGECKHWHLLASLTLEIFPAVPPLFDQYCSASTWVFFTLL